MWGLPCCACLHVLGSLASIGSIGKKKQMNLDGFFVRVFTNLEIPFVFSFILGGSVDNQGSVWRQLGALRTKDHPLHLSLGASLNNTVLAAHD